MTQTITIHTDGSCHGNPGPGGWAAIIEIPDWKNATLRGGDPETTNNRMELTAAIEGLRMLENIPGATEEPVVLQSDSKYLCDAFNQGWIKNWQSNGWKTAKGKPVKNRDLWEDLDRLTAGKKITWSWVKGHAGNHMNELCDRIANEEAEAASHPDREAVPEPETHPTDDQYAGDEVMSILEDIFAAGAEAGDFQDFRERLSRLEQTIEWGLPYGAFQPRETEDDGLPSDPG